MQSDDGDDLVFFYAMQCNVMQYIRLWIMMKAGKFGQGVFPSVPSSLSFF